jgi:nitronate monooxygenase
MSTLKPGVPVAFTTMLTERLGLRHPIIQAPLAGGGDTPELIAAVSEAGAFGFIGAAYLTPPQILEAAQAVKARTKRPFGISLFAPLHAPEVPNDFGPALRCLAPYHVELGLAPPEIPAPKPDAFPGQFAAALESGASVFSFTFGILPATAITAIKARSMYLLGTATNVEEAVILERAGVDAIVAQGSEAGGHRGTFGEPFDDGMIGTIALVPQVVDAVTVPVVASGGIMDGRGIAAALALGASAVQMGTAFLTCDEAGIPQAYKDAILSAHENVTRVTRAFSGRPARGIANRFMTEMEALGIGDHILAFPFQNTLTRPLRTAAARQGRAEYLSLWAGQGLRLARRQPASELVACLAQETMETLEHLLQIGAKPR